MNTTHQLAPDAAIALGIASTALPFARSAAAASECWLRILRLHGDAAVALQALGVGEETIEPLPASDDHLEHLHDDEDEPTISEVTDGAARAADRRGADGIATSDLLLAVMDAYGEDFDRALQAHGTDGEEVRERLFAQLAG